MNASAEFEFDNKKYTLRHGSVVIAAITSCTNTSNPSVMLGAGENIFLSEIVRIFENVRRSLRV